MVVLGEKEKKEEVVMVMLVVGVVVLIAVVVEVVLAMVVVIIVALQYEQCQGWLSCVFISFIISIIIITEKKLPLSGAVKGVLTITSIQFQADMCIISPCSRMKANIA